MDKEIEIKCPHCNKFVNIGVIIYSHDEYSCDDSCPDCGGLIPFDIQDKICNDEVTDWLADRIDSAHDRIKDEGI